MMATGASSDAEVRRNARIIVEQSARIVRLLRDVVTFFRRGTGGSSAVDLAGLVRAAVSMLDELATGRHVTIALDEGGVTGVVGGDPDALLVALTHLLENGIRVTPSGGTLHVRLRVATVADGGHDAGRPELCVDVDDDGPGVDAEVLRSLFEPFATTHGAHEACGVGLFIAQSVAQDHGGWIEGIDKAGAGARFTLHLPKAGNHAE